MLLKMIKTTLIVLLVLALLFSIVSVIVCGKIYDSQFPRTDRPDWNVRPGLHYEITDPKYPRETVQIPSGDIALNGYLFGTENDTGLVVFCHGMYGGAEFYLPEIIALVERGWQVLACDLRGSFTSPGDSTEGIPQSVVDMDNILTWVEANERFDGLKVCLAGHSWGGYAVTNVLNEDHDISAVVSFAGIYDAFGFIGRQTVDMLGTFGKIEAPFGSLYQLIKFGTKAAYTAASGINKAGIPVMIYQGDRDETINGEDSIPAHRDEITNPNVIYVEVAGEGIGSHNGILRCEESLAYQAQVDTEWEAYRAERGGEVSYEEEKAFFDTVDDWRYTVVDKEMWDTIDAFYRDAIAK